MCPFCGLEGELDACPVRSPGAVVSDGGDGQGTFSVTDRRLPALARKIKSANTLAGQHAVGFYRCCLDAGHAAIEAKAILPHGEFTGWIRETCKVSERTVRRYVQLARAGLNAEQIVEGGGVRALLSAASKTDTVSVLDPPTEPQNGHATVLPGAEPPVKTPDPTDLAAAEAVVAAAEARWEGNTPEPREADTEPVRKRKAKRAKVHPEAGPLTRMEKLEAENEELRLENDLLSGRVTKLEAELEACREG